MKKKELLALLEQLPDDVEICVEDKYGAFNTFNHFDGDFNLQEVFLNKWEESKWYAVLGTSGDEEGYCGGQRPVNPVKTIYKHSESVKAWLLSLFPKAHPEDFSYCLHIDSWLPSLAGGTQKDREYNAIQIENYWSTAESFLGKSREELSEMTLGDFK